MKGKIVGKRYRQQFLTGKLILQVKIESYNGSYHGSYPDDLPPPNWDKPIYVWRDATIKDLTEGESK